MGDCSDKAVLENIRSGAADKQNHAFRCLYRNFFGMVDQMVCQNNGTTDDAKDVFQDGVLALFNYVKKDEFEATSTLKTLVYSICRNKWLMELRKQKRIDRLEDSHNFISVDENITTNLEIDEKKEFIVKLLEKLGTECWKILEMYYFRKLKMKEIQGQLKIISEQVTKNRKSRCMKNLRQMVADNPQVEQILKQ